MSEISVLRKADIALIVVLTTVAVVSMLAIVTLRASGGFIEIIQHGEVVAELELGRDTVHVVESGDMLNVVQIRGGSASMLEANCPDGYCLHHAPVMYSGQTIVCLPNRLIVQVRGARQGEHDVILR